MFDAKRSTLNDTITKLEFYEFVASALASINCGHTSVYPDPDSGRAFGSAKLFPLKVFLEGPRVMVLSNETPDDDAISPGMEILEINGKTISEILARFQSVDASDGDIESIKRAHIEKGFAMFYWILFEQTEEFIVKAQDSGGAIVTTKLTGVSRGELGRSTNPVNTATRKALRSLEGPRGNLSLQFLKDSQIARIRIRSFNDDGFEGWMERTFQTLREKKTKTLIIDLRDNGGGADMNGALLVSYLTPKPFSYFERIDAKTVDPSFKSHTDWPQGLTKELLEREVTPNPSGGFHVRHSGLGEQQPGKFPFLGKVFILINGGTFSTAADACAVIHHLKRATFVGEETGGACHGNNSGLTVKLTLPSSRFQVRIPMYAYWTAVSAQDRTRRGTIPDHSVENQISDLLLGADAQLNFAVNLATKKDQSTLNE